MNDPRLATLSKLKDHRVYACPQGVCAWCASGAEPAQQPLWLASVLRPDLFPDPSETLGPTAKSLYTQLYSYRLSPTQLSALVTTTAT